MRPTADQTTAISAQSNVAVSAGAGTGKTQLLTERYLFHLSAEGMSPLEVVAITYTRRAASELRARIREEARLRLACEEMSRLAEIEASPIGTIHSLCARICRDHPQESGAPPSFEILDETESRLVTPDWIDEALDRLPIEVYRNVPFSVLRAAMNLLLSDPIMAARAFETVGSDLRTTEEQLERWSELGRQRQLEIVAALICRQDWSESTRTLTLVAGNKGDRIEALRVRTLELVTGIETERATHERWLAQFDALDLRGGSGKNWPQGGLDEAREAIKQLRAAARLALADWQKFSLSAADRALARMLPWLHRAFVQVQSEMGRIRRAARLIDFASLEAMAWQALQIESVRAHYRRRWRAFLVDEFQDISQIQAEIIELLTSEARLTIVGDESQSIYGFRGAKVAIFQRFREDIIARGGLSCALTLSFRSHAQLVERFNAIFRGLTPVGHSAIEAYRTEPPHTPPHLRLIVVEAGKEVGKELRQRTEARAIATAIKQMVEQGMVIDDRMSGVQRALRPGDIAVLARTWRPLEVFSEALEAAGIASSVIGGGNLLRTRVALDLVALIRFLANQGDSLALLATLRSPFFAISDLTLQVTAERRKPGEPWWELLARDLTPELRRPQAILAELLEQRRHLSPDELLRLADRLTGFTAVLASLPSAPRRLADWNAMVDWLSEKSLVVGQDIFSLWRHLRRLIERQVPVRRPPIEARDAVALLTIHSAKGLEWPVVVVADLSSNQRADDRQVLFDPAFGVALRIHTRQDEELAGSSPLLYSALAATDDQRLDEESRRLLYVALTRARDAAIITAADRKGGLLNLLQPGLEDAGIIAESVEYLPADRLPF